MKSQDRRQFSSMYTKGGKTLFENFLISINAVLPMFILIGLGILIKRKGLLTDGEIKRFNRVVFVTLYPAVMFENIYSSDLESVLNVKLMAVTAIIVLLIYFLSVAVVLKIEKSPKSRGAMIQAIYRSNIVFMGLPIATNLYGSGNLGPTAVVIAVAVPMYNIIAVITLEIFRGKRPNPVDILKKIATNPLIIGAVAGIFAIVVQLKLPTVIDSVVFDLSKAATPMALLLLGASFDFKSLGKSSRNLIICIVGKLIVAPAIGLTIVGLMGYRGIEFVSFLAMLASPTAIASYTMAVSMDSDSELAGNNVILSSLFASITMFLWIFLFKNLGFF